MILELPPPPPSAPIWKGIYACEVAPQPGNPGAVGGAGGDGSPGGKGGDTGNVHALDKGSGASVWKQDKLAYRRLSAPLIVGGFVVVGDGQGYLHVLKSDDGSFVGRLATDGSAVLAMVKTPGGLVVQTDKGSVVMVRF